MASTTAELTRLVGALEALSLEEHVLLQQRNFGEVMALHERQMPLVTRISELLTLSSVRTKLEPALRERVRRIILGMGDKAEFLDKAMADARVAIAGLDDANRRIKAIQPAYGRLGSRSPFGSFSAEG
ncbi:MAG: hypothetical protein SFV32_03825 [Opitutaceae bacterium]|nr:hypothetical protein [Opitutaceae bacterium]